MMGAARTLGAMPCCTWRRPRSTTSPAPCGYCGAAAEIRPACQEPDGHGDVRPAPPTARSPSRSATTPTPSPDARSPVRRGARAPTEPRSSFRPRSVPTMSRPCSGLVTEWWPPRAVRTAATDGRYGAGDGVPRAECAGAADHHRHRPLHRAAPAEPVRGEAVRQGAGQTVPRQPPVSAPRDSMNCLKRFRSPVAWRLTKPSLSPTVSARPSGSWSSCSMTLVVVSSM